MMAPKDTAHFHTLTPTQSLLAVNQSEGNAPTLAGQVARACQAWLMKSPSRDTRSNYDRDIKQFLAFAGIEGDQLAKLTAVRPEHVSAWQDHLHAQGLTNSSTSGYTPRESVFSLPRWRYLYAQYLLPLG
jgi:hypothetical protein